MRAIILGIALAIMFTGIANACYIQTYVINGRIVTCVVCPYHTNCNG